MGGHRYWPGAQLPRSMGLTGRALPPPGISSAGVTGLWWEPLSVWDLGADWQ